MDWNALKKYLKIRSRIKEVEPARPSLIRALGRAFLASWQHPLVPHSPEIYKEILLKLGKGASRVLLALAPSILFQAASIGAQHFIGVDPQKSEAGLMVVTFSGLLFWSTPEFISVFLNRNYDRLSSRSRELADAFVRFYPAEPVKDSSKNTYRGRFLR